MATRKGGAPTGRVQPVKGRSPFALELAERLKARRTELGLDWRGVAARCEYGITPEMVREYERGMEPRASKILLLSVALDCPLANLLPPRAGRIVTNPKSGAGALSEHYFETPQKRRKAQ